MDAGGRKSCRHPRADTHMLQDETNESSYETQTIHAVYFQIRQDSLNRI